MLTTLRRRRIPHALLGLLLVAGTVAAAATWRADAIGPTGGESAFVAVTPTRVLDTRSNLGLAGAFVSLVSRDLMVTGSITTANGVQTVVPAGATGVVLNLTSVRSNATGFVSVRPADATGTPTTSNLNIAVAGQTVANSVTVKVPTAGGDAGKIELTYNAQGVPNKTTDLIVDIVGYYGTHDHDDRYVKLAQPIVLSQSGLDWTAYATGPTGFDRRVTRTFFNADGNLVMALTSPALVGGTNYRLSNVNYCIYSVAVGSKIDRIEVWSDPAAVTLTWDDTDRTSSGCYSVVVPATAGIQPAYTLYLLPSGGGSIGMGTVTTTWVQGGAIITSTDSGSDETGGPNTP